MIARTAKNIFNEQISSSILNGKDGHRQKSRQSFYEEGGNFVKKWTVDFLNLFLGSGPDQAEFWYDILLPRTATYFKYSL